jgi:hypothetical protein
VHDSKDPDVVKLTERAWHSGHHLTALDSLKYLKPKGEDVDMVKTLLSYGLTPKAVVDIMNEHADRQVRRLTMQQYAAEFANPRLRWDVAGVNAVQKVRRRGKALAKTDAAAVQHLVEGRYSEYVVHYQAYQPERAGPAGDTLPEEPFTLVMAHLFQLRMLRAFGQQLVHLDATGGTNKNGFPLYCVLVVDEWGNGVPAGYMVTSSEGADVVTVFLQQLKAAVRRLPDGGDFKWGRIMIDKSRTEAAAIRACGEQFGYCYFHFLQEWERFARSGRVGIKDATTRADLLQDLATLKRQGTEVLFKQQASQFYKKWKKFPEVVQNFRDNWASCAELWADFGRQDIMSLNRHTNNHLERHFGTVKYDFLDRKTRSDIPELMRVVVEDIVPRYKHERATKLGKGVVSRGQKAEAARQERAAELVQRNAVTVVGPELGVCLVGSAAPGVAAVPYDVCVAELLCTCPHRQEGHVCQHLLAASQLAPLTHDMRVRAAQVLVQQQSTCCKVTKQDATGPVVCEVTSCSHAPALKGVKHQVSLPDRYCTCLDYKMHGVCAHLLAVAGMELGTSNDWLSGIGVLVVDSQAPISIAPTVALQHPDVEPLTDEHVQQLTLAGPPAATQSGAPAEPSTMAQLSSRWQSFRRKVAQLGPEQQQQALADMQALEARYGVVHAESLLPTTTQRLLTQDTRRWNRQAGQILQRALMKGRSRSTIMTQSQRRQLLQTGVQSGQSLGEEVAAAAAAGSSSRTQLGQQQPALTSLPVRKPPGHPRTDKVAGIKHGGNFVGSRGQKRGREGEPGQARKGNRRVQQKIKPGSLSQPSQGG